MAPIGTLYMYDVKHAGAHRASRILATAAFSGAEIKLAEAYVHKQSNLTPEFQAKFPIQMVPAFETADGETISEGSAIAWYVAASTKSTLLPSSLILQAQVAQWQSFIDLEILGFLLPIYGINAGFIPGGKVVQLAHFKRVSNGLRKLDDFFKARAEKGEPAFLVGGELSLADVAVTSGLVRGYTGVFDTTVQGKYPHLLKYFLSIVKHPKFASVWGDNVVLSTKSPVDLSE